MSGDRLVVRSGLLICLVLAACGSNGGGSTSSNPPPSAPVIVAGPTLTPNPNVNVPLAATIHVETDVPTTVSLEIADGTKTWTVTPSGVSTTVHDEWLLGVRPNRHHVVSVTVTSANGQSTKAPNALVFDTDPLPAGFPPIAVDASDPIHMESGVTLFSASHSGGASGAPASTLVMVDEAGEVVWYFESDQTVSDLRRLDNGHLLFMSQNRLITEMDMLGNVATLWWASGLGTSGAPAGAIFVPVDSLHHEVFPLPPGSGGDFLSLSTELRSFPNYPSDLSDLSQTDPLADVVGDVIVEFKRDGSVVREWRLFDLLDPYRVSYGSLDGFWDALYGQPTRDWSHCNAVVLDPADGNVVVSSRHQDAVFEFDRLSGDLR